MQIEMFASQTMLNAFIFNDVIGSENLEASSENS